MNDNLEALQESAAKCIELHNRVATFVKEGMKLFQIDDFIKKNLKELGCRSAFYGYKSGRLPPFPAQACLSVNDCIVHGTPGYYTLPLKATDLLKVDIGVVHKGYISDLGWTYAIKEKTESTEKLIRCGKEAIRRGIAEVGYNKPINAYTRAVQECVETDYSLFVIEALGGHFFGKRLHESPFIPNSGYNPSEERFPLGTVAVEPMIGLTTGEAVFDGWPVCTQDGGYSSHFEHNLLIRESEVILLSVDLEKVPEIIGT